MRIKLSGIFVDDQDRARAFYTEKVGLEVRTDADYGPGARWLTLVSPEDPDGTELLFSAPDDAARAFQTANRQAGRPATSLWTDDCRRDYQRLAERGVRFVMEPTRMPYGGTDALFDDTCGNLIGLHQD